MSRTNSAALVPVKYDTARFVDIFSKLDAKLNGAAEGAIAAASNASTSTPSGTYAVGDFVRNSAPAELGTVTAKYVVLGWVCIGSTATGTFRECRLLTGN